jgi:hypothetical protein
MTDGSTRTGPSFGAIVTILVAVLAAAAWGTLVEQHVTEPGFPLDDSWIHLQFARNLAEGHGFSFNAGVPSSGSTAPLWTLLLAVPLWLGLDPIVSAKALGIGLVAIAALAAAALTRRLSGSPGAAVLVGVAVGITQRMAWAGLSGMEVPLYTALVSVAMLTYVRSCERPSALDRTWGLWAGLAGWARPETFVASGILAAASLLAGGRDRGSGRLTRGWWVPLLTLAALVAGFMALNQHTGGRPLPNTFYAKHYGMGAAVSLAEGRLLDALLDVFRYPVNILGDAIWWQASHGGLLFGAALVGVLLLAGALGERPAGGRALLAVVVLTPMAKGLVAPQPPMLVHDGRYVMHLLVLGLVISGCGVAVLARMTRQRWIVGALAIAGLVQIGGATVGMTDVYAAEVKNINDLQVRTARWIAAHTAPDARVATNDIGAIAFFSRRFILDTEGLVTPDAIWDKRMWRIDRFLERSKPDVVVIFPHWYPYLPGRAVGLVEVGRISARKVIAGGDALVIYRTPWTRPGRLTP